MTRLIVLLAVLAVTGMAVSAVATRISRRKAPLAITAGPSVASRSSEDRAMLAAQLRAVAGIAFAVVMFVSLFRVSIGVTGQVGLPMALTAGVSASGGLLLFSALPAGGRKAVRKAWRKAGRKDGRNQQAADATPGPQARWAGLKPLTLALPLLTMAAYAALLVATGLTSSPDSQGRYRLLHLANTNASTAGPYPGWYYGVPLLLVTMVLAGSAFLALQRIAGAPSLPDPRMAALDRRWREISATVVVRLATGVLLGYLGGTSVVAGQAMASVAWAHDGGHPLQPLLALGFGTGALGALLALAGAALVVLAARGALTIRAAARAPRPSKGPPQP
ncbi:hypothetical protein [Arthrobacter wenxiniae]|uniref:Uncharacterized protein n=1 Tax=Arthrobacter wenxiniae TaxID=2713570 RepID=A0A7Y7LYZ5_9MICC|nr:hypothetical protein [Arthrobacter wenxiniae]NVM94076.1 hypothetical protein [Arthrobacter wenxiniae]